uniref:Odorant binding protein n=1 Tax=Heliothis virescens TaxID=7102 RepID=A0A2A4J7D8_HELVI
MTADEQLLTQYSTECISEAGKNLFVDPKQAKENNYPVDADLNAVKDISRCMMVKFGVIDPEGKVNIEGAAKYVSSITGLTKDEATEIVKKCAIVADTDNEESAIKLIECAGKTAV